MKPYRDSSQAKKGNFSLALWGEGVRRTGEGLWLSSVSYSSQYGGISIYAP